MMECTLLIAISWVCLDDERVSARITFFGLVIENNIKLVIFREI
jgi:hypothetical protein